MNPVVAVVTQIEQEIIRLKIITINGVAVEGEIDIRVQRSTVPFGAYTVGAQKTWNLT